MYEQARRDRLKEYCHCDSRRVRMMADLPRATQLNYVFLKLLQDLSTRVDESDQKKIQDALEQVSLKEVTKFRTCLSTHWHSG